MRTITKPELDGLCRNGKAIDSKGGYPAVVLHNDGTVTKFWARKKGIFSSATINPYSSRFVKNAAELKKRGIIAPKIIDHAKLEHSHVQIVRYQSLEGESIRQLLHSTPQDIDLPALCNYICRLHEKGIFFSGMHLGNILQMPKGYGLIDFTDVAFFSRPLSPKQRAQNLQIPLRYKEDLLALQESGLPDFLETYLKASELNSKDQNVITTIISP